MNCIQCKVAKSNKAVETTVIYVVNDLSMNESDLYKELYKTYGVRKISIIGKFKIKNREKLYDKYNGFIDLTYSP